MFALPLNASICTAETFAIYEAIKISVFSNSDNTIILSGFFSAITSIINLYPENELVRLIQRLISTTNRTISFLWVPSHVGISGNEKADSKANETIASQASSIITKITTPDVINNIKKIITDLWQINWSRFPLFNKLGNTNLYVKQWKNPSDISRREIVAMT